MAINANIAIHHGRLYRLNKAPARVIELALPKVRIEFFSGRKAWVNGAKLTDY